MAYPPNQSFGRRGSTGTFTDTIAEKSAEQAMLLQMDQMVANWNALIAAIALSTDTALQAAVLTTLTPIQLVP